MEMNFEKQSFAKRVKSMLVVDFRRMFTMPLFYIMMGVSFVMPVLILVMTTMMDGSVSVNPQTGEETIIEGFDNTWQVIGTFSDQGMAMDMGLTSMCNINMLYFIICVLVCIFVAQDFRSGYAKNLFAVRAKKNDYVISKSVISYIGGAAMIFAFFVGTMLGGAISGLPFDTGIAGTTGVLMCLFAKMTLAGVFTAIFLLMSVIAKEKLWLSIILSLVVSMLFFMMIPMLTPLDSTITNVVICFVVGVVCNIVMGLISNLILKRKDII